MNKIQKLSVCPDFTVVYRVVKDDGSFHRYALIPGCDVSSHPAEVIAFCESVWTEQVVSDYKERMAEAAMLQGASA